MKWLAMALIMFFAGCATTSTMLTGNTRPPILPCEVRFYSQPPERYREIAVITAEVEEGWTDNHKVQLALDALTKKAASLGANGVVIIERKSRIHAMFIGAVNNISFERTRIITGRAIWVEK